MVFLLLLCLALDLIHILVPAGSLASSLVGFLGFQGKLRAGQYGIEEYYEPWLSGQVGFKNFLNKVGLAASSPGSSLVLNENQKMRGDSV